MTVGSSTNPFASSTSSLRKSFFQDGYYWTFFHNGSKTVYSSSSDGISWSSPTFCTNGSIAGAYFSTWSNDSSVHYVLSYGGKLYYRLGSFSSGSINWVTTEQIVASVSGGYVSICVDSSNYPIIAYLNNTAQKPYAIKSEWNNGSWSTETGFPYKLTDTTGFWGVVVVPLSHNRVYTIFGKTATVLKGRLYNGSAWETEDVISASSVDSPEAISATVYNDMIHFVFKSQVDINYLSRDNSTGWSGETTLESSVGAYSFPVISCDGEKLFVFWVDGTQIQSSYAYPTIYFKTYLFGSWTTRQVYDSPSSGVNRGTLTTFYEKTSHKLGLLYTSGTSSPYNLQFDYFTYTASATPFTINNTGFDCPIFDASYDVESGILSFRTSGNVTISGATDNCLWIVDDNDYLSSWSWNAGTGEISLINVDGVIRLYWSVGAGSTTGGSTKRDTEPAIFKPVKIGSTGLYLIIGAVGVLTVAGIIKKGRTGKVRKRLNGNRSSRGIRRPHGTRRK